MPTGGTTHWSADTRRRERPAREVAWQTPLSNGDIQVIYEEDHLETPNPYYPYPDPRRGQPLRYYLGMWDEGAFAPMAQLQHDFDVRRHLVGFDRLEEEAGNSDPLCGLFRKEGIDQRPLFQRGYTAASLPFERFVEEMNGSTTREWSRGYRAGVNDKWLHDGMVNTGRKYSSCIESIDLVKWLL